MRVSRQLTTTVRLWRASSRQYAADNWPPIAIGVASWFRRSLLFVAMACWLNAAQAQDVKVNGGFLSDSLMIGEQTAFYLSAHYPSELNVLFPDSTFAFAPFEYQKRNYFATTTRNGVSTDSTVYYFTTFEVDRVQYLELPVFVVQPQDCTAFRSPRDSVLITQLVAHVPDTLSADKLPLKMNTAYQKVFFQFNFWILMIVIAAFIVIGVLAWVFFGKKIRAYFLARKLKRRHFQFLDSYNAMLAQLQSAFSAITTESALSAWKKYMEQLESRPYTKLTTKETLGLVHDEALARNLSTIDMAIYGHNTSVVSALENLKTFADQQFTKKLTEVKHGQ
jgi:hypothetical protein